MKSYFRFLSRNKLYTFINLAGLVVSLMFIILMGDYTWRQYSIDLELGQPEQAIIIPRGTFFQTTGGQWIFVLDKSGSKAYRRNIRIGRQNPQYYEVLEGLEPGERVVTSGYEAFKDNEVLVIK